MGIYDDNKKSQMTTTAGKTVLTGFNGKILYCQKSTL
jgi:hypothetical protein